MTTFQGPIEDDVMALKAVFEGLKMHKNQIRVSTELTVLELLRLSHPEFHVTRTEPSNCDLHGFAAAGLATLSKTKDECYDASRCYKSPKSRLLRTQGSLHDHVSFAQWKCAWKDLNFLLYEVEYGSTYPPPVKLYFFLSPKNLIIEGEESPTDQLFMAVGAWSTALHSEIWVFDDMNWSKNKDLWESVQGSSWDDVILKSDMKANLISDVEGFFDNCSLYKKLSIPWKRGIIFHGVPGNGKTISLKALISSLATRKDPVPSLYVKSFDHNHSEKYSIRSIFTHARTVAPCLLIFEDLDSLVTDRTRSYFLNEVDGLELNDGILMIGSTNHLETLDPAISKRPSRFDRKYNFKIPDEEERVAYAGFWRKKLLNTDMVDFPEGLCEVIGKLCAGFSFAYMKELFVVSLLTITRGVSADTTLDEFLNLENQKIRNVEAQVATEHENSKLMDKQETTSPPEKKTPTKVLANVKIPELLKDNLLLRVILIEMSSLRNEMDTAMEGSWLSGRKTAGVDEGRRMGMTFARPIGMAMAREM